MNNARLYYITYVKMEEDKPIDKKQEYQAPDVPLVTLKIGEILVSAPILLDSKYAVELIDIMIKKIKKDILEDKTFKNYISFIKAKAGGAYLG